MPLTLRLMLVAIVPADEATSGVSSLRLVRTNRPFRLLWTARTVSFLGDALSLVALMLYVAETTGQALAVAILVLVGDFAPALLGPLTGTSGLLATLAVAVALRRSRRGDHDKRSNAGA